MSTSTLSLFLRHLALSEEVSRLGTTSDQDLLAVYESERGQAAFAELMRRYGPMVLRTCRRVLGQGPDAEDAFQATFILLARKADQIRRATRRLSLGGWLHRVAYQTALDVLTRAGRRRVYERQAPARTHPDPDPSVEATWSEIRPILDAELDALPEQARQLLIACYLQGKTHAEVAAELGLPPGSVAWYLERARVLLATRLARRGVTVSMTLLSVLLGDLARGAGVPAVLLVHTLEVAMTFNEQACGAVSVHVAHLVKGALGNMAQSSIKFSLVLACCLGLAGTALVACRVLSARPDEPSAVDPAATQAPSPLGPGGQVAARVDCYGDPLPAHALARMGTTRLYYHGNSMYPSRALAFSPDGKTLATHIDGMTVCLWDATTGKEIHRLTTEAVKGHIVSLGFSPDSKTLVAMNYNQTVCRWEVATGKFLRKQEYQGPKRNNVQSFSVAFLPDGKMLGFGDFAGEESRRAFVWDVATGKDICELSEPKEKRERPLAPSAFSPDGKLLATVTHFGKGIHLWDVATGKEIRRLTQKDNVGALIFSPDCKMLAAKDEKNICMWEVATGKPIRVFEGDGGNGIFTYSPDGKILVGREHLWDVSTGKKILAFGWRASGRGEAHVVLFSPDSKVLAVGDEAGSIRLWEVASGKEISPRKGYRGRILSIAYSPDGKTLASIGEDETVRLWEAATGKEMHPLTKHTGGPIAYSPDGKTLFSIEHNRLHLWDTATGREIRQLNREGGGNPCAAAFSPDGKKLAALIVADKTVHLWEVATGKEIGTLVTENEALGFRSTEVAFSPDGRILAAPGKDNTVCLWEVLTGKLVSQLGGLENLSRNLGSPGQPLPVRSLAFSPDGRILATSGSWDEKVRLWEVLSGKEIWQLGALKPGFREGSALAFSPDGKILATAAQGDNRNGSIDPKVRLWEVARGKEIGQLAGHQAPIQTVAFSPDGKTLASGSEDLTCLVWDVTSFGSRMKPMPPPPLTPRTLPKEQLEAAWANLANDPAKAYTAIQVLQAVPTQAIALLQAQVRPVAPVADPQQLGRWIADLDANSFTVRDKAQREIGKLGEPAIPALRQALQDRPALEAKRRLQDLLAELEPKVVGGSPRRLRELRAVHVLESIGTAEARQLLQALAKGVAEASLTRDAQAALVRLAKYSAARP